MPSPDFFEKYVRPGQFDFTIFSWLGTPYPISSSRSLYAKPTAGPDGQLAIQQNYSRVGSDEIDALYAEATQELDRERRQEIVHEMLTIFYEEAPYTVLYYSPDLQAYRTDRFEGWTRQPAEIGPVLFSNTSPTYAQLVPVSDDDAGGGGDDDGGSSTGLIIVLVVLGVLVIGGGAFALGRRGSADDRE